MMASSTVSKATAKSLGTHNKSSINSSSSLNLRDRLPLRSELKSSIPKPTPPRSRLSVHSKCFSSSQIRPLQPSKIPKPVFRSLDREKTCLSLQATPRSLSRKSESGKNRTKCQLPKKTQARPRSAFQYRGAYSNIKAKVDCKPTVPKLKSQFCPLNMPLLVAPGSNVVEDRPYAEATNKRQNTVVGEKKVSNEEALDTQKQILKMYTELIKLQSPKEVQPLEKEICRLMQNKTLDHIGNLSCEYISILPEGSPEFLSQFGKQMQEVEDLWLRLIGEVTNTMIIGNPDMANKTLSTDALNMRDELNNFFTSLSSQGEHLQAKLKKIETDLLKAIAVVFHNGIALSQKNEELKDNCFRLEKTQDQINFELKEQIAILGEENEILNRKYEKVVEKYNTERLIIERQEKQRISINNENTEVRKVIKLLEAKCHEFEVKTKKGETTCRALESLMRNKEVMFIKENKNNKELQNQLNNLKDTIKAMQSQLSESNKSLAALEKENQNLQEELGNKIVEVVALKEKVNEADKELTIKNMNLIDTQKELDEIRAYFSKGIHGDIGIKSTHGILPTVPMDDLRKENDQKTLQIQELRKKLNTLEHILQQKSTKEEDLLAQIADLKKSPFEKEVLLNQQIQELKFELKGVSEEKEEFEKMVAQKNLELDQRDLLMREYAHVLRDKDELIPKFQSHQRNEKNYIEELSAIVVEQHRTYLNQGDSTGSEDKTNIKEKLTALEKHYSLNHETIKQDMSFRQEKMCELYSLMEHKQMEMLRLEQRVKDLQSVREEKEQMEREKEARISFLQRELEGRKNGKSRSIFSTFFAQDEST